MADNSSWQWSFWAMAIVAALLLFVANSAIWVNQQIFNSENFTNTASSALLDESSRLALGAEITNRLYENRPALQSVAGEPTTRFVSGLLGSSIAENATDKAISRLQIYMTSPNPQSIELDLQPIKEVVQRVATVLNREESLPEPGTVPNSIMLVDASKIPSFYQLGVVFLWLAPISLLAGIGLLIWPYWRRAADWMTPLKQGVVVVIVSLLAFSMGPLFKPTLLANITNPNVRIVADNIYDAFMATFNTQTLWLLLAGLLLLLAGGLWQANNRWGLLRKIK